jgi:3-hydroxyacyl-CoA dehydrogenase
MPLVAIVGAGLIGRAWAVVFARAGFDLRVYDPDAGQREAAPDLIRAGLAEAGAHGLLGDPDGAAARVTVAETWRRRSRAPTSCRRTGRRSSR